MKNSFSIPCQPPLCALLFGALALMPPSSDGRIPNTATFNNLGSLGLQTAANKTYFLKESENLRDWFPVPIYVLGDGTQKTVPITPSVKPRMFYKFVIAATNSTNPNDTDGDGISNNYEYSLGLDPNWMNSVTDLATAEVDSRTAGKLASDSLRIFNNYNTNG